MKNLIGIMILIVCCFWIPSDGLAVYGVGDAVANVTLPDGNGQEISLFDFDGMAVLLYFWGDC